MEVSASRAWAGSDIVSISVVENPYVQTVYRVNAEVKQHERPTI